MDHILDVDVAEIVASNLDFSDNRPLKSVVYNALRTTILKGEIPAGTRINESVLAERVSISRTTLRYALQKLHKEHLLDYKSGRGMIVKGITIKDASEIFTIRKSLDYLATITAMYRMDESDFQELEEILILMNQQTENTKNLVNLFTEFNEFIYEKSQIYRLKDTMVNIQNYLTYFRSLSVQSNRRRREAITDHRKIYLSMRNKEEEQLKQLIDQHLDAALLSIVKEMDEVHPIAL